MVYFNRYKKRFLKKNLHMAKIAFDIDNTLAKIVIQNKTLCQIPDYDLIQVLRWFVANGDEVFAWSGGGVDYVKTWLFKLGLQDIVKAIPKVELGETHAEMDIAFDDSETSLAKATILVKRDTPGPVKA